MKKQHLSILAFSTLLCVMLFGSVSCRKDDTIDPAEVDFFIEANYLPGEETNGEAAPRFIINFNDEAVMIELRPNADTLIETVLFLCPDHEAYMMCGNKDLMVFAPYDMETNTPSRDVLLVTPMDENALVLTKGFMDWNTNAIATGDMMVLPVNGPKSCGTRGGTDGEIREFFFNRFVKPLAENFEKAESYCSVFGSRAELVFSYIRITTVTGLTTLLYSDDSAELLSHMEQLVTTEAASGVQQGVFDLFPQEYSEMASKVLSVIGWYDDDGHGKVGDYEGGGWEEHNIPYATLYLQGYDMTTISSSAVPDPLFIVNLNVVNVTENSAYFKGSYRFGNNSSITPVEMGYVIQASGGSGHTEHDMYFQGITLSGLQKATKYTAYAYVKSVFGDVVYSPGVTFWTLGFEVFPNSLSFPAEGGTQNLALSYSLEDITYCEVTSSPQWCSFSIDDLGLLAVTVGETTESRSGTITITAHSNALGMLKQDIAVTQGGANGWDGSSWLFAGSITNDNEGYIYSGEFGFTLIVNSVSNNDIIFDFAQYLSSHGACNTENYVIDENGCLVYSATGPMYEGVLVSDCQITFVRTGPTTATADFYWHLLYDGWNTVTGSLQGTLMNAKEINDYETTFQFKDGILGTPPIQP